MSDLSTPRSIAIPLRGFPGNSSSNDCMEQPDHLFVGREAIIDKLVDLLNSNRKRGSYLIAGYRGAGKTSVINKAINKYKYGEKNKHGEIKKRKALVVRINLGDTSQLTPLGIYYSIANILREELTDKSCSKWERAADFLVSFKLLGVYILLALAGLIFTMGVTQTENLPYDLIFSLLEGKHRERLIPALDLLYLWILMPVFFFLLVKSAAWGVSWLRHPERRSLPAIDYLIERISNEISEGRTAELRQSFFTFGRSKLKRSFPMKAREAEEVLFRIFRRIQSASEAKIMIVLDEIDKLSDGEELSEIQDQDNTNLQEAGKISKINTLLGSLKNFITTAEATFFFISGRETLDRYLSEKGSSNSLYESLFDRVFEVPSFLTDKGDLQRGNRLSALIEEYVCRRIRINRGDSSDKNSIDRNYYSLTEFRSLLKSDIAPAGEAGLTNEQIRQGISVLRNFIHYLTFHSWGNPKRLSSLFENFIVLKKEVIKEEEFRTKWGTKKKKEVIKGRSALVLGEREFKEIDDEDIEVFAEYWLVFNSNHQRSFSLASELTTLFSHQLGREVSKISDKLTVSTLSSLHYILKLHHYGFTRESLFRMSEAINVYRSTELNTIIDDLLTHVFKSYIRRVRNGVFRYRFNSAFEQELRYISHGSELESATYNFSLDSMRNVRQVFEDIRVVSKDKAVVARSHITLGDIHAIEQSYTAASVHYGTASRMLTKILGEYPWSVNSEILMQCIEAMVKHGDLEERRQNYNLAASIYFEANRIVEKLRDDELRGNLMKGDSKLDLLKQPFWAASFLSLKRSPRPLKKNDSTPNNSKTFSTFPLLRRLRKKFPGYLYRHDDPRFYYRSGTLSLFLGEAERASILYDHVLHILERKYGKPALPDERVAYLDGKARVGMAESALIIRSRELYKIPITSSTLKGEREFAAHLLEDISGIDRVRKYLREPLETAAKGFEENKLYISAATAHIKAISYYAAILDVFDSNIFHNEKNGSPDGKLKHERLMHLTDDMFMEMLELGKNALRCIDKARQLETSQNNKTFVMHDLESIGDEHEMTITRLFEMLTGTDMKTRYPVGEPIFWQNSLWAHKLAATLCWAYYVKQKIEIAPGDHTKEIWYELPDNLPSILGISGFSVRPAILLRWIWARGLNRQYINRKLMTAKGENCNTEDALALLSNNPDELKLTACGEDVVEYIFSLAAGSSGATKKIPPPTLQKAYLMSRYLYLAQESSRIISRKNLDLIFPRLPQIYFGQWKLLVNLILAILAGWSKNTNADGKKPESIRKCSLLIQRAFTIIDQQISPDNERIAASHFDYEFIYLRLSESLESSINMVDRTSRTHMSIFQHKYYCHDDHSDPDFQMDYTLAYMFAPRARYIQQEVVDTHDKLKKLIQSRSTDVSPASDAEGAMHNYEGHAAATEITQPAVQVSLSKESHGK
jgi:Cdc6-like AAA superfamily ATPase